MKKIVVPLPGKVGIKIITIVLSTLLISACAALETSFDEQETPPNIVLILSDDHAWNDYGFMGHELVNTSFR
jgi:uncharacterized sulfatase